MGENGHLQTWTHALVPFSCGLHMFFCVTAILNEEAALIERHGIDITISVAVVRNAILIEPIIRWRDQPRALHLDGLRGAADVWRGEPDPAAADAAAQIRRGLRDLFQREAAVHLQIGKFYAYREGLGKDSDRFLMLLKHALDPHDRINPGALGLG